MNKNSAVLYVAAASAFGALLRLRGISHQPMTTDEMLTLPTALGYVRDGMAGPVMPFHPHLRDLGVAATAWLFGPGVLGVRGLSLVLGTACLPLLGHLVWRLTKNAQAAGLAVLLLAVDPVSVFFNRQAIQEIWTPFFALLGTALVVDALERDDAKRLRWELPVAGLVFGLGVATKFYVVPVWGACAAAVLWVCVRHRRWPEAVFAVSALGVVPGLVFLLTYWPWFTRGYSAAEWFDAQSALFEAMRGHTKELVNHWRFSRPSRWFVEPFIGWAELQWFPHTRALGATVGNPLVWMLVLPAAGWAWFRNRARPGDRALLGLFFAAYLPLVFASRPVWLLSSMVVLPFAFALVALAVADVEARWPTAAVRAGVRVWMLAVIVASLAVYPAVLGHLQDVAYLRPLHEHLGTYVTLPYPLP